ncbi:ABC-three component system protein [Nitrosomonas sp.]|uniref:ABC-three component system protein n=1 Tax=Nitrosomonas sp. TaxID=42353 RepID=UPI001DF15629|nr:ABC-three component system protein [Nitrosomonas sp.]MBX3618302.1 hypothetical protein [Nitrosomonas sp.]
MKYAYEDLSDSQFERLAILICQRLLGISVQGFAEGPDGGRDAKFVGTAELHPSKASPWKGTTIVQAKHTNGYNRSYSETDFFSPSSKNTVIEKEIPRIASMRRKGQLDHYMLFSNRRMTGIAESAIRSHISNKCGLPEESIYLVSLEQLDLYLKRFREIADEADLDPLDSPLIISPDDLAEVVEALAQHKDLAAAVLDYPPEARTKYREKNSINKMTAEYAQEIRRRYLKESRQIESFLAAPENFKYQQMYESIVEELQLKIIAKRKQHQTFDGVMEHLIDVLFSRDPILRQRGNKRLTRGILFFMYWNCDIGESSNAEAN